MQWRRVSGEIGESVVEFVVGPDVVVAGSWECCVFGSLILPFSVMLVVACGALVVSWLLVFLLVLLLLL